MHLETLLLLNKNMISTRFEELKYAVNSCVYSSQAEELSPDAALQKAIAFLITARREKSVVYVIGNGGSAGFASHFSSELIKNLDIPSQTLYDSNLLTCLANDLGYEQIFSNPLSKLLKTKDILVAISSSGKSPNILKAANTALSLGVSLITFTGYEKTNPLRKLGHLNFWIDCCDSGLVEISHFFFLHSLIDLFPSPEKTFSHLLKKN